MPDEAEADRAQVQILHAAIRDVQAERDAAEALGRRLAEVLFGDALCTCRKRDCPDSAALEARLEKTAVLYDDTRKAGWLT